MQLPVVGCGAKGAPFIESERIASDKTYYRKQVQLPIVECGERSAPFIRSEEIVSDKTYYRNQKRLPIVDAAQRICLLSDARGGFR